MKCRGCIERGGGRTQQECDSCNEVALMNLLAEEGAGNTRGFNVSTLETMRFHSEKTGKTRTVILDKYSDGFTE